ncbi:MAG: hypothetical protein WAM28_00800 [Chlamydiales bacterium]
MAKNPGQQKDESKQILEEPEGFEDIKKKYEEREAEQLKKALAKRKVGTLEELKDFEARAIINRAHRADHKVLKDQEKTIFREAKSPEIAGLKKKLEKEIYELAQEILRKASDLPPEVAEKIRKQLPGRIKPPPGSTPSS